MPYVRVRRSKNASNYGLGMPAGYRRSLPPADNRVVRLEKTGVDVVPRLITDNLDGASPKANVNQFTFAATRDAKLAFNPLHHLVKNVQSFGTQKALYKEYRMKQVKVHVMLEAVDSVPLDQWTNGAPLTLAYSWSRSSTYTGGAPIGYDVNVVQPNCTQKVWGLGIERPEFWTSITATNSGGEGNWLNCAHEPGTSPNTGMFFMPEMHLNVVLAAAAASGKLTMHYEVEYVIEFRGSLQ